jgi:SAM-dependent methyltransferase
MVALDVHPDARATESIVRAAQVTPGMEVLDIASGTGEPALTLAETAGHVTATDLGPQMLVSAEENARARGVGNVTFTHADVHELPFGDASFDRVTCRFGIMYFADVDRALGEIRRVLARAPAPPGIPINRSSPHGEDPFANSRAARPDPARPTLPLTSRQPAEVLMASHRRATSNAHCPGPGAGLCDRFSSAPPTVRFFGADGARTCSRRSSPHCAATKNTAGSR